MIIKNNILMYESDAPGSWGLPSHFSKPWIILEKLARNKSSPPGHDHWNDLAEFISRVYHSLTYGYETKFGIWQLFIHICGCQMLGEKKREIVMPRRWGTHSLHCTDVIIAIDVPCTKMLRRNNILKRLESTVYEEKLRVSRYRNEHDIVKAIKSFFFL